MLSSDQNRELKRQVSDKVIEEAAMSIQLDKALRPNGFSSFFLALLISD